TVEVEITVTEPADQPTDADKYDPEPNPVEVEVGGTVNPDDTIGNLDELPDGTTVTLPDDFNTDEPGVFPVDVTVTYPDGSSETVEVEITVTEPADQPTDADKYDPKPKPVEVEVGEEVDPEDTVDNLDELPDGTKVDMDPVDTSKPGVHTVEVTVTYPDGSTDTFTTTVTVKAKPAPHKPHKPGYGTDLPHTGADVFGLGLTAALAMMGGFAAIAISRRRRDS
ncbi:MAG: Rib/alpha-like domain-containing protein, partial [Flaviflexus sp.]|nr:Rib/alpha-like domain-containing protein [Flaviflexus sp.]